MWHRLVRVDVSNANTPGRNRLYEPGAGPYYRVVAAARLATARMQFTETNAYSGDNGRAAILNDGHGRRRRFYTAGNAGNGTNPQPHGVILGAGAS